MGGFFSFRKEPVKTPISGYSARIRNILRLHYRGVIGMLVPLLTLTWHNHDKADKSHITICMWLWMTWNFFIQPVNIPVVGLIPIFVLPMTGVVSTDRTCACYMTEGAMMFILSSMVGLLLNNSGFDRRFGLWFLCSGDTGQYSAKRLTFKCSMGAFFLSMISSRLISSAMLTEYVTKVLVSMENVKNVKDAPDYKKMRSIINSAISTSSTIGSIGLIHSSYAILIFRLMFNQSAQNKLVWPDIFNYLEYSSFAIPVAAVMLVFNVLYHTLIVGGINLTVEQMNSIKSSFKDYKKKVPNKVTTHEKITIFCLILILIMYFFRWNKYFHGWSYYRKYDADIPQIEDATVAGAFVFLLHAIPNSLRFTKKFTAKKKSELMPNKPESGILWWRFVDKNTNYGYMYLMGSGVALMRAIRDSNLNHHITKGPIGKFFTEKAWPMQLLLITAASIAMGNIVSPCAACVALFPLIANMYMKQEVAAGGTDVLRAAGAVRLSSGQVHLACLACGVATSLSFMFPFLYTPSYFCHYVGKVPKKRMAPYGFGSVVICCIILWLAVTFYAPLLWGSLEQKTAPVTGKTTVASAVASPAEGIL